MNGSSQWQSRPDPGRGPAIYLGYSARDGRYRMMDLSEYVTSVQQEVLRLMNDTAFAYGGMLRGSYQSTPAGGAPWMGQRSARCDDRGDCHCDCCVGDTDVLVHARVGETRRISITLENDTRRERPVKLELGSFVTAGGRDLGWQAHLSETEFTLPPCGERTVSLVVNLGRPDLGTDRAEVRQSGLLDRCEVGYATVRAEGCLTRPIVIAVAVLPDDCDSYRRPCGCDCCRCD